MTFSESQASMGRTFLISLRSWEWTKNVVMFTGVVFAHRFHDVGAWWHSLLAFAAFYGLSGAVYVSNDHCLRLAHCSRTFQGVLGQTGGCET